MPISKLQRIAKLVNFMNNETNLKRIENFFGFTDKPITIQRTHCIYSIGENWIDICFTPNCDRGSYYFFRVHSYNYTTPCEPYELYDYIQKNFGLTKKQLLEDWILIKKEIENYLSKI